MKKNFPGIKVFGEATNWDGAVAAPKLQTDLTANPDIKGVYMQSSFALAGTLQVLKQKGLLVAADGPQARLRRLQRRHPRGAQGHRARARSTPPSPSRPTCTPSTRLYYVKAAIDGKTFKPGKTDHDSTIIQVRDGLLEDQLSAPLVTADGATYGGVPSAQERRQVPVGQQPRLTTGRTARHRRSDERRRQLRARPGGRRTVPAGPPVVEATGITKRYGPTVALDDAGITDQARRDARARRPQRSRQVDPGVRS